MEYKRFGNTVYARLNRGEEIIESITALTEKEDIRLARVTAIGATDEFSVGLFDYGKKKYISYDFSGEYEILSLLGNITRKDDKPYLHLHMTVSGENGNAFGGHLSKARISVTCEITIDICDGKVGRKPFEDTPVNVFDFE